MGLNDERQVLLDGFRQFRKKYYNDSDLMKRLVDQGANPQFFIIHCMDPRSGAGKLFNADPGAIFGKRPMAAFVAPFDPAVPDSNFSASLSYAVNHKKVKHIIVLGHTHCGGIEALVHGTADPHIHGWMDKARPAFDLARRRTGGQDIDELCRETERQTVVLSLKNLLTYPFVKQAYKEGKITINGWLFDMGKGDILGYEPDTNKFISLIDPAPQVPEESQQKGRNP